MAYASWEEEQAAQAAELAKLRQQNLAAQGQVSPTPFFGGSAYDPAAASGGTGRGALSVRGDEVGYYGGGQWNSLGQQAPVGSPQWLAMVQQASYEGDKEAQMMAQNAQLPAPAQSYTHAAPPSWSGQPAQQQAMYQPQGGGLLSAPFRPQGGSLLGSAGGMAPAGGSGNSFGSGLGGFSSMNPVGGMNSFFAKYWGK